MRDRRRNFPNNPIVNVIFQLNLLPILRIETETPNDFQDSIRASYPIYKTRTSFEHEIHGRIELNQYKNESKVTNYKTHAFSTLEEDRVVSLNQFSIALTANKYSGWNNFKTELLQVINDFSRVYNPIQASRIGLRYINIIDRSKLFLDPTTAWKELIRIKYLGLLGTGLESSFVTSHNSSTLISRAQNSQVNLRVETLLNVKSNEACLAFDMDSFMLYSAPIVVDDLAVEISLLHENCEEIFFQAITPKLQSAMKGHVENDGTK